MNEEGIRGSVTSSLSTSTRTSRATRLASFFNRGGKTDILIRVEDANVFIGECKIWKGPKTIPDALDQLLGYLVWRDTKAALLLFIRQGEVSTIVKKAIAQIETHPNYKRRGRISTEERYDFVVHTKGDSAREINLALIPFLIPKHI
jgi:hypothetical protein